MVNFKISLLSTFLSITLFSCSVIYGQNKEELHKKTYMQLFEDLNSEETLEQKHFYASIIIDKAKKENNSEFLILGYHTNAILYEDETMLRYCDSIIALTESNSNETYPAEAYQLKGYYYFNSKNYKRALDNYLKVSFYAKKFKDEKLNFKSNYSIGIIKRLINEKEAALALFKENYNYAKNNLAKIDTLQYLNSITAIANIFNDMKLGNSSSAYNKLGFKESVRFKNKNYAHHFSLNQGLSLYYKEEYEESIDSLEKHIPFFKNTDENADLSLAYYYCGASNQKINNLEDAIFYYKKVDTVFREKKSIYPISRDAYIKLISYYKKNNDLKNQLLYVNQLIEVDSILNKELLYLNKGIYVDYDIPNLKLEKKEIINEMNKNKAANRNRLIILCCFIISILGVLIYQINRKKVYKKRFEDIIKSENEVESKKQAKQIITLDISENIIIDVLESLDEFEQSNSFLSTNISLNTLAKEINTNSSYLSKIVNHYKNKSFSNYLNTLRIDYFIKTAKTNPNLRKYTVKAIASEMGFKNSESFSKAFYKSKGIKPSYFIKEIEKSNLKN